MEIINKGKPKQPPFIFKGHPKFTSATEARKYFDTEYSRWVNGYATLTGRHYFYLTMGHLKPVTGMPIMPYWRDGDHELFHADEAARKKGNSFAVIKRREFGLTSIFGGNEPIYNCLVNPGSINLITSADRTRVKNLFSDKTMFFFDHLPLPDDMIPTKKSERQDGFLNISGKKKSGVGSGSQVWCLETANDDKNAKRFETFRAMSIFLDEWFLHKRASIVFKSSQACLRQGFETIGHMVLGGSCGGETEEEVKTLKANSSLVEEMIADAEAFDMDVMFVRGTLCIAGADELDDNGKKTGQKISFMHNGYSDQAKAEEWINKRRAILEKARDKSHLYNFIKSYPLTLDEVFTINKMGILPPEVYASLDVAKRETLAMGERKVGLRRDSQTNNILIVKDYSYATIVEEPKPNLTYISGTDPIPLGKSISEDGSDYANIIYCEEEEKPVAMLAERTLDADVLIRKNILLQQLYKSSEFPTGAPTMVEYNMGGVAMRIYEESGFMELLADRPKHLGFVYEEQIKGKKGWFNNDKTMMRANSYLSKNLIAYADRLRILRLIEEAARFPNGNLDVLDAYKSMLIYYYDRLEGKKKAQKVGAKYIDVPYYYIDSSGRTVKGWKKKEIR